jgi:transcriptional regulator with XRE-family HTH domain
MTRNVNEPVRLTYARFRALLDEAVAKAGSQKAAAIDAGISQQYLADLLRGRRQPGPKVLTWLKLREVRLYEQE